MVFVGGLNILPGRWTPRLLFSSCFVYCQVVLDVARIDVDFTLKIIMSLKDRIYFII
jgi:hypothetical protein